MYEHDFSTYTHVFECKKSNGDNLKSLGPYLGGQNTWKSPKTAQLVDIHQKSMRPRFFIFCSYLLKKLSGGVLAPSDPSLYPQSPLGSYFFILYRLC